MSLTEVIQEVGPVAAEEERQLRYGAKMDKRQRSRHEVELSGNYADDCQTPSGRLGFRLSVTRGTGLFDWAKDGL